MKELGKKVNLVICQKSKVADWVEHFREHYPELKVFDATSSKKDEKRALEYGFWMNYRNGGKVVPSVIVINYDLVWRRKEYLQLKDFTLMLDESSLIQNHGTKRTKYILRLQPANVILLSGTPTSGRYERLWTQMHLLGWPISRKLYEQTYVIWDYIENWQTGYRIPVVKGYKNVDRLKRKMAEYGCVFMKSDEFGIDLPDQQDITIKVKPSPDYKRFMKHRYLQMPDGTELVGDTSLTSRLYARMLCGQYNKEKLAAVKDLIESTEDRLIIFYNFTAEMEALRDLCINMLRPVSIVNGKTKDLRAYEKDPDSITLIQYQAGAYGLNLQKARRVIYFTLPESSELFEQSRKRIHRIGQDQKCFYYIPICQGSIETRILQTLKERKDYTDALFKKDFE
jgi:SNF2 family DNA or RNA helicase